MDRNAFVRTERMAGRSPTVRAADLGDREIVRQLLEFNAYEFSRFDGADLDGNGRFGYAYLDLYWTEPGRRPYLILVGASIAGMALVREGPPHSVAEFLIMPKYRRAGVGTTAARDLLSRHPGRWELHQVPGNERAVAFWRHAIPCEFTEHQDEHGITQTFTLGIHQP
ncbi:MAG: GNAT family N-acetyltransferase [Streptosporangiaceae bacterium]